MRSLSRSSLRSAGLALAVGSCAAQPPPATSLAARGPERAAAGLAAVTQGLPSEEGATVPISAADPVWGSRTALVTIVAFGDFQCPYTGRILPTLLALQQKYGPADLRVVWKELPLRFHDAARPAAEAAESVFMLGRGDAFWKFWAEALRHQGDLSTASLESSAQAAGVDLASYRRLVEAHAAAAKVDADGKIADRLGVHATPEVLVNGVLVEGAQPLETFTTLIDAELAKARARLASGVAPEVLYAAMAQANWHPPVPEDQDEEEPEDTRVWNVAVGKSPTRGGKDALVTIVEFSDFQCPYCKRVEGTLQEVLGKYGDKVRLVWKDEPLPFHDHALPAAELAREARAEKGDAGFWRAHDALFDAQPKLADDDLLTLGKSLGLNAAHTKAAIKDGRFRKELDADVDQSEDLHAEGTPHFFINGRRLVGAQPLAAFSALIDAELKKAEDLVAHGTPRAGVYEALMKTAEPPAPGEVRQVPANAAAPFKGPVGARVVIEEFADFQCPYCARAEETLADVVKSYRADVKVVWRNLPLPFHAHARLAAEAAAEAQQQKGNAGFWAMHGKLMAHQRDGLERDALDGYARELGLDVPAFDRALDAHTHAAEIDADLRAADAAHIGGTPAFVIGGYYLSGAQPFSKFRRLIDKVLASGPAPTHPARPEAARAHDGG